MATHKTLLGDTTFDGEFVGNDNGSLFTQHFSRDNGKQDNLQARDNHWVVSHSVGYTGDNEVYSIHSSICSNHSEVCIAKGRGYVTVSPSHPRYDSFPFPEEEISPCGARGKIIAQWDISETSDSELPF